MKTKTFFFYLAIVAGYGSIPNRTIKQQYISHELILLPLRFSFFVLSLFTHTSDSRPFPTGERGAKRVSWSIAAKAFLR